MENNTKNLKGHYRNLITSLNEARDSRLLLPVIHDLAAAARQLNRMDHQENETESIDDQQQGILALLEMMQHRLVITSLSWLKDELLKNSEGEVRLRKWISLFDARVTDVFPNFPKLESPDFAPPEFQVVFTRGLADQHRFKFIEAILEFIMILTPGQCRAVPGQATPGCLMRSGLESA